MKRVEKSVKALVVKNIICEIDSEKTVIEQVKD